VISSFLFVITSNTINLLLYDDLLLSDWLFIPSKTLVDFPAYNITATVFGHLIIRHKFFISESVHEIIKYGINKKINISEDFFNLILSAIFNSTFSKFCKTWKSAQ
jgi:hypothetical protein